MGILNKSIFEILYAAGKGIGKGTWRVGKAGVNEIWHEGVGITILGKDFTKYLYNSFKNRSGKLFEKIDRKEAKNYFSYFTGMDRKRGHVGEKGFWQKVREAEPVKFGYEKDGKRYMNNGGKVGFIPKVVETIGNGAYHGVANLPFKMINDIALSPIGRVGAGIAGAGFLYGGYKGLSANSLSDVEAGELADMSSKVISPLLNSDEALKGIDVGFNNHGAEGNLVFALHNLRQGG